VARRSGFCLGVTGVEGAEGVAGVAAIFLYLGESVIQPQKPGDGGGDDGGDGGGDG